MPEKLVSSINSKPPAQKFNVLETAKPPFFRKAAFQKPEDKKKSQSNCRLLLREFRLTHARVTWLACNYTGLCYLDIRTSPGNPVSDWTLESLLLPKNYAINKECLPSPSLARRADRSKAMASKEGEALVILADHFMRTGAYLQVHYRSIQVCLSWKAVSHSLQRCVAFP
jgi:hypothetical protein